MSQRPPLDRHALGQALSWLANARPGEPGPSIGPDDWHAKRLGLTGAPGAGKSTLAGQLALHRAHDRRIAVLAVDPSSPRSGGAILGDRIRMDELPGISELFIRSIGSRSTTDGLSDNLPEMLDLMDRHRFDEVLLETVGVGQAEYAVRQQVDTLVLVLLPESGDIVQAMKAGIMELADIYVINKADLPGAQKMATDIQRIAALTQRPSDAWRPPVLLTSSSRPASIAALSDEVDRHQRWLADGRRQTDMRRDRVRYRLRRLLERRVADVVRRLDGPVLDGPFHQLFAETLKVLSAAG